MAGDGTKDEDNIMYSDKENVNILTSLLVAHGVRDIVVCPGSRNAPLVHNFNECPDITCFSATDERSAGFLALGLRQQTGIPVAVCVTSGSALLNVLPAVAEATYQQQGIIVISADRPEAWIGQLDGQTVPQPGILGTFSAKSVSLPEPCNNEQHWHCNRLVNEALLEACSPSSPSVHINVPISEPLFSFTVPYLPEERTVRRMTLNNVDEREAIAQILTRAHRLMVVTGQMPSGSISNKMMSRMAGEVPLAYEPLSASDMPLSFIDQCLYAVEGDEAYFPDCVVYLGGNTISKRLRRFLRSLPPSVVHITASSDGLLHDISGNTAIVVKASAEEMAAFVTEKAYGNENRKEYHRLWASLRETIAARHYAYAPRYSQMMAVKEFEEGIVRAGDTVYYANSMSIRLAAVYARHYVFCNRGVNGIEGSMSVAVGGALSLLRSNAEGKVYCVIGDLSFFYDNNALWNVSLPSNLRIILLNNGGGAIFRNLKGLEKSDARERYIAAAHKASARGACLQNGLKYLSANDATSLHNGLYELSESKGATLLEVFTSPEDDERAYKDYYLNLKP